MILYASNPDALASQRMAYDQFYNSANQQAAARADAINANNVQNLMRQRQQDIARSDSIRANDSANNIANSRMAFQAQEDALNRGSSERNVDTQYSYSKSKNDDEINQQNFRLALSVANHGELPESESDLGAMYPGLTPSQIKALTSTNNESRLVSFKSAAQKNFNEGNPILPSDVGSFISKTSPVFKSASDFASTLIRPVIEEHDRQSELARAGNLSIRIAKDAAALTPGKGTVQPSGSWQKDADKRVSDMKADKNSSVVINPATGNFEPTIPNYAWMVKAKESGVAAPEKSVAVAPPAPLQPPAVSINHLIQNPQTAKDFDNRYGQGSSAKYLSPQAPANPAPVQSAPVQDQFPNYNIRPAQPAQSMSLDSAPQSESNMIQFSPIAQAQTQAAPIIPTPKEEDQKTWQKRHDKNMAEMKDNNWEIEKLQKVLKNKTFVGQWADANARLTKLLARQSELSTAR